MKLSILCPALFSRRGQWSIVDDVRQQCIGTEAELIVLMDDGRISVGEKHNMLFDLARGEYICTVADDDGVSPDYVASLLEAIGETDVVTFIVDWQGAFGWQPSSCGFKPLAPTRADLAKRFMFPDWWQSEDKAYATWLEAQRPSVKHIDRPLYRYNFRRAKPEYGGRMYPPQGTMASPSQIQRWVRRIP